MSKKLFATLIIILIALFGVIGWYLWGKGSGTQTDTGSNFQGGLFPAGSGSQTSGQEPSENGADGGTTIDLGGTDAQTKPRLRRLSTAPSAGVVAFDIASTTRMRFVERATGHVYETSREEADARKISNTTLPKIHEALWSSDGSKVLMRYLKDATVRTFYAQISSSSPETSLEGLFLADDIQSISVQGSKAFSLEENGAAAKGSVSDLSGAKKTIVFSSTFGDWDSVWSSSKFVTLFPRPSGKVANGAYLLDVGTGKYTKVAGDLLGLRALGNPDGSLVLYSVYNGNGDMSLLITDVKAETSLNTGLGALVDKCVWSTKEKAVYYCAISRDTPQGLYPDDWYKGNVSFNDSLWRINAFTGETEEVFDPLFESGESMDMIDLSFNKEESMLVFLNKKDMTPWAYDLKP